MLPLFVRSIEIIWCKIEIGTFCWAMCAVRMFCDVFDISELEMFQFHAISCEVFFFILISISEFDALGKSKKSFWLLLSFSDRPHTAHCPLFLFIPINFSFSSEFGPDFVVIFFISTISNNFDWKEMQYTRNKMN